jgi:hypothetical protein
MDLPEALWWSCQKLSDGLYTQAGLLGTERSSHLQKINPNNLQVHMTCSL